MSQENVDLARRNWELWNQGADDELFGQMAPDVEWHHNIGLAEPGLGQLSGARGSARAAPTTIRDSFGVARFEVEDVRDLSPIEVLTLGRMHLEGRGSGAAVTAPFGAVTDVLDGLVVRQRFWTDQSKALEAAGVSE